MVWYSVHEEAAPKGRHRASTGRLGPPYLGKRGMSEVDLQRALNDPADVFEDPDAVVSHPALTREQKVQILNNWQLDGFRCVG